MHAPTRCTLRRLMMSFGMRALPTFRQREEIEILWSRDLKIRIMRPWRGVLNAFVIECSCRFVSARMRLYKQWALQSSKALLLRTYVLPSAIFWKCAGQNSLRCQIITNRIKLHGKRKVRLGRGPAGRSATWGYASIFFPGHWIYDFIWI